MKKIVTTLCIFVFLFSANSFAQFKLSLAPALGFNFNLHTGSDLPESGNGFGIAFGGYADMDFSQSIGLVTGLAFYDNRSGSYSTTGTEGGANYEVETSASLAYFQIESLFKLKTPANIYFVMGPVLGFNVESEGEQTITITTPGFTFQDGTTTQKSKSSIKETLVRFELKAGAGMDIPISPFVTIAPQLTFGYGLTNVVDNVKWKILTIQGMVFVKFSLI